MSIATPPLEICLQHAESVNTLLRDLPGLEPGAQSRVGLIDIPGLPELVFKRMGVNKELDHAEASQLHTDLLAYRGELVAAGWNIPTLYDSLLANVDGEWQIWGFEQFIAGATAKQLFEDQASNAMKRHVINQVLRTVVSYDTDENEAIELYGRRLTPLPHGVDLKPDNLVVDNSGVMWMVDTFGPKGTDKQGGFISYSHKLDNLSMNTLAAVCSTRQGAMFRFLRKSQKLWLGSGSSDGEEFIEDIEYALALTPLPDKEAEDILTEINNSYPWLETVYSVK